MKENGNLSSRTSLLAGFYLSACGGIPKPKDFTDSPDPIFVAVDTQRQALKSLTAELQLDVWKDDQRIKLKQLMAVDHQAVCDSR